MITVIASIKIKKNYLNQFIKIFKKIIPQVLSEDGCIEYYLTMDAEIIFKTQVLDEYRVIVVEKWQSVQALKKHAERGHMQEFEIKTEHMIESFGVQILKNI